MGKQSGSDRGTGIKGNKITFIDDQLILFIDRFVLPPTLPEAYLCVAVNCIIHKKTVDNSLALSD